MKVLVERLRNMTYRVSKYDAARIEEAIAVIEKMQKTRLQAIIEAIEGECEGLAIDENQAARILMHLDSTSQNGIVPRASSRTEKPVVTPVGWRLMPTSLTLGMRMAMAKSAAEYMRRTGGNSLDVIYEAAISSSPASEGEQK